ncbi:hypothetical protein [Micromonospora sp. S4605]|uniref:hypothetical protein n=1 Tax=Micromonospora sp. S4605 TaxID=1420897 RepID=UPI0011B44DA1|nr:hypothetical protein [Micromonospora sp. S4605]
MATENSASRLMAVLEQVRAMRPSRQGIDGWMEIFGASDRIDVLRGAAELADLVDQFEADVRALPEDEDPEHLLAFLPKIRNMIGPLFHVSNTNMQHFSQHLTEEVMYSVAGCSRALRRNGRVELSISPGSAKQLVDEVRAVIEGVIESDLPDALKDLMVDRLRDVERALLTVRIGGYASVEKAMDALTFGAVRATKAGTEEREKVGGWLSRLWGKLSEHAQGAEAIAATAASTAEVVKAISGG